MVGTMVVDTGGWCTGECCDGFVLTIEGRRPTTAEVLATQAENRPFDLGHLWMIAIPYRDETVNGKTYGVFGCPEFDRTTRRCRSYRRRPFECREYPGRAVCRLCGFSMAKRRRAAKRVIRELVSARRIK